MLEVRNCRIRISRSRTHRTSWFRDFRTNRISRSRIFRTRVSKSRDFRIRTCNVYDAGKKDIKEVLDNNLVKPLDEKFPA